jgi:hypothetical protein
VQPVRYYIAGLDPYRVLVALAIPCIAATVGVGVACGLLKFTLADIIFLGGLFALAGAAAAGGLALILFALLGERAGAKPLRRGARTGAKGHQALVLARR